MVLDKATPHKAEASLALAAKLHIRLLWLPKQWAELNAMDHLWRDLKKDISSNYQYNSIGEQVLHALIYIKELSDKQARLKAGILSDNFWLKAFL